MDNTKNLNLKLPSQDDFYNVDDFNENFQKMDDFVDQVIPTSHYNVSAISNDGVTYNATIDGLAKPFPGLIITIVPNMASTTTKVVLTINGSSSGGIYHQSVSDTGTTQTPSKNDWLRANRAVQLMYNGAVWMTTKTVPNAHDISGTFEIEQGGTGATTKEDALVNLGLNNIPNVATNDQTPTYEEASKLETLSSGEKLSVAFGKIKKAISDFITHKSSAVHITSEERTTWNSKAPGEHGLGGETKFDGNSTPIQALKMGSGFYSILNVNDSKAPSEFGTSNAWMSMIQVLQSSGNGAGFQITSHRDHNNNVDNVWFRTSSYNTSGDWHKLIHSENIGDYIKIQSGTYVGTGTYGSTNKNSLTFAFVPKVVFIFAVEDVAAAYHAPTPIINGCATARINFRVDESSDRCYSDCIYLTWNDKTLSWYASNATYKASMQLNVSGVTYKYVAIG